MTSSYQVVIHSRQYGSGAKQTDRQTDRDTRRIKVVHQTSEKVVSSSRLVSSQPVSSQEPAQSAHKISTAPRRQPPSRQQHLLLLAQPLDDARVDLERLRRHLGRRQRQPLRQRDVRHPPRPEHLQVREPRVRRRVLHVVARPGRERRRVARPEVERARVAVPCEYRYPPRALVEVEPLFCLCVYGIVSLSLSITCGYSPCASVRLSAVCDVCLFILP